MIDFKIILKSIFFFMIMYNLEFYSIKKLSKFEKNNMKVCLCTLGKEENKYITEFVEYYKNYKIDKIYLYDNNDIDGEHFEDKIQKYIISGLVEIIDWRGIKGGPTYYKIMDNCYQMHHNDYDWLIFYEIDEFLYLKNFTNIKNYLKQKQFNKCDSIQLNWVHRSDNNKLFFENKPLQERFPKVGNNVNKNKLNMLCNIKSIIRGHIKNITINHNHLLSKKLKGCNGFGRPSNLSNFLSLNPDYEFYYINHYYTKTVEEFIEKMNRGDLLKGDKLKVIEYAIEKFFYINDITSKKISFINKYLGKKYNLTECLKKYKNKIN